MNILKFKGLYLTLTLGLIILYLSLQPPSEADIKHLVSDKMVHLIAYFILVFPVSLERIFPQLSVFLVALAYGGCIELLQPLMGREADMMDFFANAAGIILGILVARGLTLIFKVQP